MHFSFDNIGIDDLEASLLRVVSFLRDHGADELTELSVKCSPRRNGTHLIATGPDGYTVPIVFVSRTPSAGETGEYSAPNGGRLTVSEHTHVPRRKGLGRLMDFD